MLFRSSVTAADKPPVAGPSSQQPSDAGGSVVKKILSLPNQKWGERAGKEIVGRSPQWLVDVGMQVRDWWKKERLSKAVEGSLPNRKLDALAIESKHSSL